MLWRRQRLLEIADESIGSTLKKYELDQELGEVVNELTEAYYAQYPRAFDAAWPSEEHRESDVKLRALFEQIQAKKGCTVKVRPRQRAASARGLPSRPPPARPPARTHLRIHQHSPTCRTQDFKGMAKEKLGIELEGGDTGFTLASLFQKKRQGEMNAQVGA